MSKNIDLSKKLSDEDVEYLKQRSRHADLAENARILGDTKDEQAEPPEDQGSSQWTAPDTAPPAPYEEGTQPSPKFVQRPYGVDRSVTSPLVSQEPLVGDVAASGEEDYAPEDLSVEELKDELRDRDLPTSGNKDELVKRLKKALKDEG